MGDGSALILHIVHGKNIRISVLVNSRLNLCLISSRNPFRYNLLGSILILCILKIKTATNS